MRVSWLSSLWYVKSTLHAEMCSPICEVCGHKSEIGLEDAPAYEQASRACLCGELFSDLSILK